MTPARKTILLTGASGLIGRELSVPLSSLGFDMYALTIDAKPPENGIHWIPCNLFDTLRVKEIMRDLHPTHLLNMAWTTTGDYLKNQVNYDFLAAGINLSRTFAENGGSRAVFAGTCFEYRFKNDPIHETDPLDVGKTNYTFCKNELHETAKRIFTEAQISFGYGRIFFVFGKNESPTRLTGSVITKLLRNETVVIKGGPLLRDYMYTKDIANAFAAFADSSVTGDINISTGNTISIHDYVDCIARKLNRQNLVLYEDNCQNQPPIILGNNTRLLREVGYKPRYTIPNALDEIIGKD